jgi:tripartite-type tricarboxylate transporter receptor subunit TctC
MTLRMKSLLRALLVSVIAAEALIAGAQTAPAYPNKPIKVLVGVPPGGSTDALTRMFADWLQESMGQPTIVDNRPGANTVVAADAVAKSPPDGYTLLVSTEAFLTMPLLVKTPFDPFKDFAPVGTVGVNRFVFAVHPSVPVANIKELIAYAKSRPGKMNYGSSGNAGASHLGGEKFKLLTGTHILHIPNRGAGPALTDPIAGQYELSLWTPLAITPYVKSGKLKPLAVTGPKRMAFLPNVPTFAEAGLPQYDHSSWLSVYAPAGTPKPIVDRLNAEIAKMVASPKIAKKLEDSGVEPFLTTPQQLADLMHKETAENAKLIKAANIRMD